MTPKEREKQLNDDMRDVLKTMQGRRVIWEIMDKAGLMSRLSAADFGQSQRALGKRDVALLVHDWVMSASPRALLSMLEQRAEELEKKDD